MFSRNVCASVVSAFFVLGAPMVVAQEGAANNTGPNQGSKDATAQLIEELRAHEARIKELEEKLAALTAKTSEKSEKPSGSTATGVAATPAAEATPAPPPEPEPPAEHEHTMRLPGGGPELKIRGFADFNLGFGSAANALIFPLPAPVHNTFQFGEVEALFARRNWRPGGLFFPHGYRRKIFPDGSAIRGKRQVSGRGGAR
jgi:hypothetical protein